MSTWRVTAYVALEVEADDVEEANERAYIALAGGNVERRAITVVTQSVEPIFRTEPSS